MRDDANLILLTGATGYVGGRLLHELEAAGYRVRCLSRRPEELRQRVAQSTEVVQGDVLDPASLASAMAGVHTAYYLVHAMASANSFEEQDRRAAHIFAEAARAAGVKKIIYLGGLGSGSGLSAHLRSRQEVGRILRESGVPTIEFRASIVIGSGSVSFEMIRALVEKLPVMITPRWVRTRSQPIAVEDVIAYLVQALALEISQSSICEIGGADCVAYLDLMKEYAHLRGLKRWMIPVPVLSPHLSSLWLGLVTPVYARVGRELVDSLRNETVVRDASASEMFPIRPLGYRAALQRALANEDRDFAETRWSDAFSSVAASRQWGGVTFGRRIVDSRSARVPFSPDAAFRPIERLGGQTGWYYANWLWKIRGWLDLLTGGAGMRRGRRDPDRLFPGDTVDFWRVEQIQRGRLLRLAAEMRLPGRAWLQFEVDAEGSGSIIRQTAIFDPVGVPGQLYWYLLYPVHQFVFAGMLQGIVRAMGESR
ncbi:MAG TPA: SDR family oxidoreductase, partial [Candidatus Dormibacteraeota bacterium]|nr:SDR family oxidoreductase [Candidatus Dormibacteraeota bacterium]